jgi:hypothetical protein
MTGYKQVSGLFVLFLFRPFEIIAAGIMYKRAGNTNKKRWKVLLKK